MEVIVSFIDENRSELGVEPVCRELQVATSTYYAAKSRALSARAVRDAALMATLVSLWTANFKVYGVRKLWRAAKRAGEDVGRDQVARLMRLAGIEGLRRGKKKKTTKPDPGADRHPDLVGRNFKADAPDRLWVSDLTYVATWSGFAYVFHRRRLQPDDRRMERRHAHAHRHGVRRLGHGCLEKRNHSRGPRKSQRCRQPIHVRALWRAPSRSRRGSFHRVCRRLPLNRSIFDWQ